MKTIKVLATLVVFTAIAAGLFYGPRMLSASATEHHTNYVSHSRVISMLTHTKHSQASKGGSFLDSADIQSGNVKSANQTEVN